jgi:hypothetical protein
MSEYLEPRVTEVNAVTSDLLPTICDLIGQPLPNRPLDGISLAALLDGQMTDRPKPICFWNYNASQEAKRGLEPYIEFKLQEGTTPLVKLMDGRATRNFRNVHHPMITQQDYDGPRAILGNRYKLVVGGQTGTGLVKALFALREDQAEENNLIDTKPEIATKLERQLQDWQQSVLNSLTGGDY